MIKWTTPSLKCTIPEGIEFTKIILTLSQGDVMIEKEVTEVLDNQFVVTFTQEETGQFDLGLKVEAQLNIINHETRIATNIIQLQVTENLHNSVIDV